MKTAALSLHLPQEELEFAERYAREHQMTLTELIDRQIRRLRAQDETEARDLGNGPREGLASLLGRWEDGDELADEVDHVVACRSRQRPVPDFEA